MTLNAKALEAARKRLQENLDSFDKEIAYQISTEGERADLWTEIDVNADDLRTVLSSLPHVGVSEEALGWPHDVVEALKPFATFAEHSVEATDNGWIWRNCQNDRICDWFGPSDFGLAKHFAAVGEE